MHITLSIIFIIMNYIYDYKNFVKILDGKSNNFIFSSWLILNEAALLIKIRDQKHKANIDPHVPYGV